MSLDVRAIRLDEREECLNLWCTVWPNGGRPYFERYLYSDVEWLPYYTQVAVDDGKIVSAVHICKRTVAWGEFRLTMGGIANVATLPEYRGMGFSSACMEAAVQVMEADAMDFSMLGAGIRGFYERFGYTSIERANYEGDIPESFGPSAASYAVRPAEEHDWPAIREIYRSYNAVRPIAVQRDDAYWRGWLHPRDVFVAYEPNGHVRGYVHCSEFHYDETKAGLRISELGVDTLEPASYETIAAALIESVTARYSAAGAGKVRADIAFDAPVLSVLERVLLQPKWNIYTGTMVRLLHADNLLHSLLLEMNSRWADAGRPGGTIAFATPYGEARLIAAGEFLRVSREDGDGALPQPTLFALLLHGATAAVVQAVPEESRDLAAAVFPVRSERPVYWPADGF